MLIVDTNILVRCVVGRAISHVERLLRLDVRLATTNRNAAELFRVLTRLGPLAPAASTRVDRLLSAIEPLGGEEYEHLREAAEIRLREGGKSDWPVLAAALALDAGIWSQDLDFFGVGVAVWSTDNVHLAKADPA